MGNLRWNWVRSGLLAHRLVQLVHAFREGTKKIVSMLKVSPKLFKQLKWCVIVSSCKVLPRKSLSWPFGIQWNVDQDQLITDKAPTFMSFWSNESYPSALFVHYFTFSKNFCLQKLSKCYKPQPEAFLISMLHKDYSFCEGLGVTTGTKQDALHQLPDLSNSVPIWKNWPFFLVSKCTMRRSP